MKSQYTKNENLGTCNLREFVNSNACQNTFERYCIIISYKLHKEILIYFVDRGGWERWFMNSSDPLTNKLLKKVELVPDVRSGIRNTTKAFFWSYAFLGSKAELEYIVQANYSKAE